MQFLVGENHDAQWLELQSVACALRGLDWSAVFSLYFQRMNPSASSMLLIRGSKACPSTKTPLALIFKIAERLKKRLPKLLVENHRQYKTESRLSGRKLKRAAADLFAPNVRRYL